nr:CHAT domain-containing protein [Pirellulales bacterium]
LENWLALPKAGPQRIALPGMHTLAERGGKTASRRRGATIAPGDDLFYASCGLMSAGAETMLLSRWRVGGQSTIDLVREFVQELPHAAAAEAWQRSVQLAMQMPIDPLNELRVKSGKDPVELTASHPFFWAGYVVIDSGWRPEEEEEAGVGVEKEEAVEAPAAEQAAPLPAEAVSPPVPAPPQGK